MSVVEKVHLCADSPAFSPIIVGCWRLKQRALQDQSAVERFIARAIDLSLTSFDHADIYGHYDVQRIFGDALTRMKERRSIEIITKVGIRPPNAAYPDVHIKHYDSSCKHILESVDRSLADLGVESIDLLLLHRFDWLADPEEIANAFSRLKSSGKVKSFGTSNFSASQFAMLETFCDEKLVTNQVEFSLLQPECLHNGVFDACMSRRIRPMAWSPLGGGGLFGGSNPKLHETLMELSGKYGVDDITSIALRWIMEHPSNAVPIVGTTSPENLDKAAKACEISLDRQDWYALYEAAGNEVP